MIALSVDTINQRAPYHVRQIDDSVFVFVTKHGISYTAGFVADVSFYDEGVYQNQSLSPHGDQSKQPCSPRGCLVVYVQNSQK